MNHLANAETFSAGLHNLQHGQGFDLIDAAAPAAGEEVLDLGCGTGILTRELARRVGRAGTVIGIDPDMKRLDQAEASKPPGLTNLHFLPGRGVSLSCLGMARWDLIFSSYVAHWIDGKQRLVQEMMIGLKPGGRIAFELCGELSDFVEELLAEGAHSGQRLPTTINCLGPRAWRDLLEDAGFQIRECALLPVTYGFAGYPQFEAWWEGATRGAMRVAALRPAYRSRLEAYFEGGGSFDSHSVRFLASKPRA